jgi:hypothetical protein
MAEIVLVRQDAAPIAEADREAARRVLFGQVDGLSEQHKKSWRRMMNWLLNKAEPGEMLELKTHRDRLGWFHRKHMALEQAVFEAQEKFEHFEQFRLWLKVGAGFVEWLPGPKGGVIPVPKSISYGSLEQDAMEKVHDDIVKFLRQEHAQKALWRHLNAEQRAEMMAAIIDPFEHGGAL